MSYNQSFFKSLKYFLYHFSVARRPFSTSTVFKCQNIFPLQPIFMFNSCLISFAHDFVRFSTFLRNRTRMFILFTVSLCSTQKKLLFGGFQHRNQSIFGKYNFSYVKRENTEKNLFSNGLNEFDDWPNWNWMNTNLFKLKKIQKRKDSFSVDDNRFLF